MTLAPDPIEQGLVVCLSRPGGNVTGLISVVPGVSQKYIELLREAVPSASRFVVVGAPNSPFPAICRELQAAAQQAGINISFVEIVDPNAAQLPTVACGRCVAAQPPRDQAVFTERLGGSYAPPMLLTSLRSPTKSVLLDALGFRRKRAPATTPIAKQIAPVTYGWE